MFGTTRDDAIGSRRLFFGRAGSQDTWKQCAGFADGVRDTEVLRFGGEGSEHAMGRGPSAGGASAARLSSMWSGADSPALRHASCAEPGKNVSPAESAALIPVTPTFSTADRLALTGFLAARYSGLTR